MSFDVILMGSSTTQNWLNTDPEFFLDNKYLNRGVCAHLTSDMLLRFQSDVIDLSPRIVVLSVDVDDIAQELVMHNQCVTLNNVKSMTQIARNNNIDVIITSVLPATHIPWQSHISDVPERIAVLNAKLLTYAYLTGIAYVDYYSHMVDAQLGLRAIYTADGVHPTVEGYKLMGYMLKKNIDSLARKFSGLR